MFHSSPSHCDAADAGRGWSSLVDNPDLVHTTGQDQSDLFRGFVAPVPSWTDGTYDPPAADSLLPNVGGFPPPINTEFSPWAWGVYARESFTPHPNYVSGETTFPQDSGPLIQPPYSPRCAAPLVSTIEDTQPNHPQLPRSESQEPPLIANRNYVRCEMSAQWRYLTFDLSQNSPTQHSTFGSGLPNNDPSFSPNMRMTVIPQRPYARTVDREKHKPIIFKVNGCLGIPARDAIRKAYAGLEGRDDQVFVGRPSVIMLRLEVRSIAGCDVN